MARNDPPGAETIGAPNATKGASCPSCKGPMPLSLARTPPHASHGMPRGDRQLALGVTALVACVAALLVLRYALAPSVPPGPDVVTEQDAGKIQDVHLQSAALGSETTVRTSVGIYQVRGGVSVAIGDEAKLRRTTNEMDGKPFRNKLELCVDSKIKTSCYELL